jgi:hypothetical protein
MEKQSLLVLKSKAKVNHFIYPKITAMFLDHEDAADSDFIKAYKAIIKAMNTSHSNSHSAMKEREGTLI